MKTCCQVPSLLSRAVRLSSTGRSCTSMLVRGTRRSAPLRWPQSRNRSLAAASSAWHGVQCRPLGGGRERAKSLAGPADLRDRPRTSRIRRPAVPHRGPNLPLARRLLQTRRSVEIAGDPCSPLGARSENDDLARFRDIRECEARTLSCARAEAESETCPAGSHPAPGNCSWRRRSLRENAGKAGLQRGIWEPCRTMNPSAFARRVEFFP